MDNVKIVELDTQPAVKSIKELRTEIKACKDAMASMEEGSDEFLAMANKAGTLKHQMDEINESVKGASADFGDMLSNGTSAIRGLIGGFQAAQGALTLFGVESEEVTKAIQKMQASMAVVQGLDAIDKGIKSLAKLRNAITSTTVAAKALKTALEPKTIIILTTAIAGLVAVWNKFGDSIEKALPFITKIKNAFNDTKKSEDDAAQAQQDYVNKVTEADKKVEEFYKNQQISKLNKDAKKQYDELKNSVEGYRLELEAVVDKESKEGISQKEWNEIHKQGLEITNKINVAENKMSEILSDQTSYIEQTTDKTKERTEAIEEFINKLTIAQAKRKALYGEKEKPLVVSKPALPEETEEVEDTSYSDKIMQRLNSVKDTYAIIRQTEEEYYAQAQSDLDALYRNETISNEEYTAACKNLADERAEYEKQKQLQTASYAASGLASLAAMLSSFSQMCDTNTREGFEMQKKLQISSAIMSTLSGIIAAWTSSMALPAPASFIMGAIQTAATASMGAANIANIQKQEFGTTSTLNPALSNGAMSSIIIPPTQYTQAVQGANIEQSIGNSKQYVAVTEIERVRNKVNVAEYESRY